MVYFSIDLLFSYFDHIGMDGGGYRRSTILQLVSGQNFWAEALLL